MTPEQLVNALNDAGTDYYADFHEGLNGYFGWSLFFENGDLVLKAGFKDPEAPILDSETKWVLTPVKRGNHG